ncbi:dNA replication protein DnaC [Calderihabitans maritimus]|uniref:DNA replication protein DnaC n=2 Tax=Calderihabitans maritimus TaxID=1246530 RepID=A0A1Z5HSG4_9FIRM|nr:dNA replication protein DnaC [Calderihabitans maritimus]
MVLERRMTAAGIPQEFWDADLERIDPSIEAFIVDKENNRDIPVDLRVFGREYVSKIKELRSRGGGVFVQGKVDCGKTYFACAILKEALGDGWSGAFYTVEQYLDALKTAYEDEQTKIRLRQQREKAQIWVMDDLGAEYLGSDDKWALARLDDFFRWADSQRRLVIVTTNILSKEVLTERYHQRIVSIFKKYINTFINHPTGFRAKQGQTTLNLFLKDANKYP